ncbi:type II toxin-antitoxin system VapC family toxin [Sinorhizobium medicae]
MSVFVLDATTAAAWLLPEEHSEIAEQLIASISGQCPVPGLFWHEARSNLVTAERRQRAGVFKWKAPQSGHCRQGLTRCDAPVRTDR